MNTDSTSPNQRWYFFHVKYLFILLFIIFYISGCKGTDNSRFVQYLKIMISSPAPYLFCEMDDTFLLPSSQEAKDTLKKYHQNRGILFQGSSYMTLFPRKFMFVLSHVKNHQQTICSVIPQHIRIYMSNLFHLQVQGYYLLLNS